MAEDGQRNAPPMIVSWVESVGVRFLGKPAMLLPMNPPFQLKSFFGIRVHSMRRCFWNMLESKIMQPLLYWRIFSWRSLSMVPIVLLRGCWRCLRE